VNVLHGLYGQFFLLVLFLVLPELFHLHFDALAGIVQLLLVFDLRAVYSLLKEVSQSLQLFNLFLHVLLALFLHLY
jgi:hypothetical protein